MIKTSERKYFFSFWWRKTNQTSLPKGERMDIVSNMHACILNSKQAYICTDDVVVKMMLDGRSCFISFLSGRLFLRAD